MSPVSGSSADSIASTSFSILVRLPMPLPILSVPRKTGGIPEPSDRTGLARDLLQFARSNRCDSTLLTSSNPDETLPPELLAVLNESFVAQLAETFRNASHDGSYQTAFTSGETLLALYRLIYPENYPQIGLHLLELAKTYWNGLLVQNLDTRRECLGYLTEAKAILSVLGPEGDEGGPLVEISTLESLLLNQ
ncbi:unnamed protein product [Mycena citricolor]|uniref:Uncharacterized protein n=1 Tax=Mycena citricolor TaxID=2018698 RepID=A0AAD2K864_9AGAR|nr:unnamed protein product [Mycena citricolor]